jgi:Cdc6-like AAA superfamily ATPase
MNNSNPQAIFIKAQTKIYFQYLQTHIATNSMVSKATGIPQKNLTRYKREFEDAGLLFEVYKGICKLTKFRATYLTTNKALLQTKKP